MLEEQFRNKKCAKYLHLKIIFKTKIAGQAFTFHKKAFFVDFV